MTPLVRAVDGLSWAAGRLAMLCLLALMASMLYEVVARYAFGAPTLWSFDVSYMLNGALFLLAAGFTLREKAHVRIDFLAQRLPLRWQRRFDGLVFLLVLTPIFVLLTRVAADRAWVAFVQGRVEHVSPWAPKLWPFYSAIALGLACLTLQLLAEALKALFLPQEPPAEGEEHHV